MLQGGNLNRKSEANFALERRSNGKAYPIMTYADFSTAKRMIVKIGSALLVDPKTGELRAAWLESLCLDLAELKEKGKEIVIVSSGAIALGRTRLGLL